MLSSYTDKVVTWVRNPHWDANSKVLGLDKYKDQLWNVDGWTITFGLSPDQQLLKLKSNEADMSWNAIAITSLGERKRIENDPELKTRFIANPDPFVRYLAMDVSKPPFDNIKLRQAANYAIDREAVVKIFGDGTPWSQILGEGLMPKDEKQLFPTKPDVEKAKQLVQESGVSDLSIKLGHVNTPPSPQVFAAIKANLEAVGFKVTLVPHSSESYYSFLADPKNNLAMRSGGWAPDWPDGGAVFIPLLNSVTAGTSQNLANMKDPALDAKMQAISSMPYGPERAAKWQELSRDATANITPWVVTRNGEELNLLSNRIGGFNYNSVKLVFMDTLYIKK
jgi:peptide/nickel transport system substrate-binding protein